MIDKEDRRKKERKKKREEEKEERTIVHCVGVSMGQYKDSGSFFDNTKIEMVNTPILKNVK